MIATELRIGNWVQDAIGRVCKVTEIHKEEGITAYAEGGFTSLPHKPLPLTEEWLEKLGFYYDLGVWRIPNHSITATHVHPNGEIHLQIGNFPISIRYVHQLQNLYYALTREELKVKG